MMCISLLLLLIFASSSFVYGDHQIKEVACVKDSPDETIASGFAGIEQQLTQIAEGYSRQMKQVLDCNEPATNGGTLIGPKGTPITEPVVHLDLEEQHKVDTQHTFRWLSQSGNQQKHCGGDEYRVHVQNNDERFVVPIADNMDGSYSFGLSYKQELSLCRVYELRLVLYSSQGHGFLFPPARDRFLVNRLDNASPMPRTPVLYGPLVIHTPCKDDGSQNDVRSNNAFCTPVSQTHRRTLLRGKWMKYKWHPFDCQLRTVAPPACLARPFYTNGDSLTLMMNADAHPSFKNYISKGAGAYILTTDSVWKFANHIFEIDHFATNESNGCARVHATSDGPFVLLTAGTWDILDTDGEYAHHDFYVNYGLALYCWIIMTRKACPRGQIYFRLTPAMHLESSYCARCNSVSIATCNFTNHLDPLLFENEKSLLAQNSQQAKDCVECLHCHRRLLYMSDQRVRLLNQIALTVADALAVPVLDFYSMTESRPDLTLPGDGRHYNKQMNYAFWDFIMSLWC